MRYRFLRKNVKELRCRDQLKKKKESQNSEVGSCDSILSWDPYDTGDTNTIHGYLLLRTNHFANSENYVILLKEK